MPIEYLNCFIYGFINIIPCKHPVYPIYYIIKFRETTSNVKYEKTYSNLRNSWRHNNPDLPMTLDYVMIKSYKNKKFCIKKAKVLDLTLRHPDTDQVLSISDHEPIEVEIEYEKKCWIFKFILFLFGRFFFFSSCENSLKPLKLMLVFIFSNPLSIILFF